MKKIFLLFLLLNGWLGATYSQVPGQKLVPKAVLDKYATDFPGITPKRWVVKWGKQYEAVIIHNNKPARARYYADGKKHFVAYHYKGSEVPATTCAGVLAQFTGFKVDWATQVVNSEKGTDRFWLHLSKPGHILKVFVNADGTVVTDLKEEEMKDFEGEEK